MTVLWLEIQTTQPDKRRALRGIVSKNGVRMVEGVEALTYILPGSNHGTTWQRHMKRDYDCSRWEPFFDFSEADVMKALCGQECYGAIAKGQHEIRCNACGRLRSNAHEVAEAVVVQEAESPPVVVAQQQPPRPLHPNVLTFAAGSREAYAANIMLKKLRAVGPDGMIESMVYSTIIGPKLRPVGRVVYNELLRLELIHMHAVRGTRRTSGRVWLAEVCPMDTGARHLVEHDRQEETPRPFLALAPPLELVSTDVDETVAAFLATCAALYEKGLVLAQKADEARAMVEPLMAVALELQALEQQVAELETRKQELLAQYGRTA